MTTYLGLGANLGDRLRTLRSARQELADRAGLELVASSPVYETAAVGGPPGQPPYLNAVLALTTDLAPRQLLALSQTIEDRHQRRREVRWGSRTLDIDLLLYGEMVIRESDLTVPHPALRRRAFVLKPLADLAPGLVLPGQNRSVAELLADLPEAAVLVPLHREW